MEEQGHHPTENHLPVTVVETEYAALDIIRTETVLSRLPVHNLAKKGSISISILKRADTGEIELLWKVSPSRDYGEPRQLAYKLDTIVINQRIDEADRPLPKILRLGSLNEICTELGVAQHGGKSKNEIKRAFFQNVGALITAKFNYRGNDGTDRRLEAAFTRYTVIFTGEKLPDGRKADAVYVLNEPFWEILNNAPVRPLDRAYMKQLPPAAQRFYEIITRKIFAALKNHYPTAKISYSEYCTLSAQIRHFERQRVQDQMAKVLRHHKQSGYITAVRYEPKIDVENKPDWIMYLTPGPKARAEFAATHGKRKILKPIPSDTEEGRDPEPRLPRHPRQNPSVKQGAPVELLFDSKFISEFTRRGIAEQKAVELLANLKPGQKQNLIAQLEHAEYLVRHSPGPITNPAGFIVRLIQWNTPVPDNFETSAKRKIREERERREREERTAEQAQQQREWAYEEYCATEVDRYLAAHASEFATLVDLKYQEGRERFRLMTQSMARIEARQEVRKQVSLLTFEEFLAQRREETHSSPKPREPLENVELPAAPVDDLLTADERRQVELEKGADVTQVPDLVPESQRPVEIDPAIVRRDNPEAESEVKSVTESELNPPTAPALSEPMIVEIVSEPHHEAIGGTAAADGIV